MTDEQLAEEIASLREANDREFDRPPGTEEFIRAEVERRVEEIRLRLEAEYAARPRRLGLWRRKTTVQPEPVTETVVEPSEPAPALRGAPSPPLALPPGIDPAAGWQQPRPGSGRGLRRRPPFP
jgi:hypothetical protein